MALKGHINILIPSITPLHGMNLLHIKMNKISKYLEFYYFYIHNFLKTIADNISQQMLMCKFWNTWPSREVIYWMPWQWLVNKLMKILTRMHWHEWWVYQKGENEMYVLNESGSMNPWIQKLNIFQWILVQEYNKSNISQWKLVHNHVIVKKGDGIIKTQGSTSNKKDIQNKV